MTCGIRHAAMVTAVAGEVSRSDRKGREGRAASVRRGRKKIDASGVVDEADTEAESVPME